MNTIKIVYVGLDLPHGNLVDTTIRDNPKEYQFVAGQPMEVPEEFGQLCLKNPKWKLAEAPKKKE